MHDKRVIPLYTDHSGVEEHIYLLAVIIILQSNMRVIPLYTDHLGVKERVSVSTSMPRPATFLAILQYRTW